MLQVARDAHIGNRDETESVVTKTFVEAARNNFLDAFRHLACAVRSRH
jgi:hypothetical protein